MDGTIKSVYSTGQTGSSNSGRRQASLTGLTLIRQGNALGYPWKQCIINLLNICDEVIVNVDPAGEDRTFNELCALALQTDPNSIKIIPTQWDMSNKNDGSQLAYQINVLLPEVRTDWILYLQADEFLLESNRNEYRDYLTNLAPNISQVELYRTYFFGSTKTRLSKEELWLGRIFRKDTHYIGGDGMYLVRKSGDVARMNNGMIYHYSRVGSEDVMNSKLRTLDSLFHDEEEISTFPKFSYSVVDKSELLTYIGPHPIGIEEFYNGVKK